MFFYCGFAYGCVCGAVLYVVGLCVCVFALVGVDFCRFGLLVLVLLDWLLLLLTVVLGICA